MLYFLYNLSPNAEASQEPRPVQDPRGFSREPTTPSKRQSVAASSHAFQDAFAKPGLKKSETFFLKLVILLGLALFVVGVMFAYKQIGRAHV